MKTVWVTSGSQVEEMNPPKRPEVSPMKRKEQAFMK